MDAQVNSLDAFWMPFTANRQFKASPRLLVAAKDMHYTSHDGRQVLDGAAGLWCVNAGHCRPRIAEAIAAPGRDRWISRPLFQMAHPLAFEWPRASRACCPTDWTTSSTATRAPRRSIPR